MKKDPRDIFGEYDPPYPINSNPTQTQKEAAENVMAKYEKLAAERRYNRPDGEYDRPLPQRIENPTKEDWERLQQLIGKYPRIAEEMNAMTLLDLYWMTNPDWYDFADDEVGTPFLTEAAPPEAKESFSRYLEQKARKKLTGALRK